MGLSSILQTSTGGLQAVQTMLQWRSDNITNAQDPTYGRRGPVTLSNSTHGVSVTVQRAVDDNLQTQYLNSNAQATRATASTGYFKQVADVLGTSLSTPYLQQSLDDFTGAWKAFETDPTSTSSESQILSTAQALATTVTEGAQQLDRIDSEVRGDVGTSVTDLNSRLTELEKINKTLSSDPNAATNSPNLLDKRDNLVRDISGFVGVTRILHSDGSVALYTKNGTALIDHTASQFQWNNTAGQAPSISLAGTTTPSLSAGFLEGKIGAALNFLDTSATAVASTDPTLGVLAKARAQYDMVAAQLSDNVVPASGLVAGGTTTFGGAYFAATPDRTTDLLGGPAGSYPVAAAVADTAAGTAMSSFFIIDNNNPATQSPSQSLALNASLLNGTATVKRQSASAVVAALTDTSRSLSLKKAGNTTNGSAAIAGLPQTSGLIPGMTVTGAGIPAGTTILTVNSATSLTLSNNATATGAGASLTFGLAGVTATNRTYSGLASAVANYQSTSQAAVAADDTRLTKTTQTLDSRLSGEIGVNMDSEMAQLTVLQNAYSANARVINVVQTMFDTLLQIGK